MFPCWTPVPENRLADLDKAHGQCGIVRGPGEYPEIEKHLLQRNSRLGGYAGEVRYPGAVLGSEKNHLNSSQKVLFFALFLLFKLLFYGF